MCGEPGTGKTALLMECVVRCVLPTSHNGHGAAAVLVDTTGGFDCLRLAAALKQRLGAGSSNDVEADVNACLNRVQIVQCLTPRELVLALCALRLQVDTLLTRGAAAPASAQTESSWDALAAVPRLLVIDTLNAFQWLDNGPRRKRSVRNPAWLEPTP